jgi:hypothetical protein
MKCKLFCRLVLSVLFLVNISFAVNSEEVLENPYDFELVEEAGKTSIEIESGGEEKVDMEEVNKNDTYQAQSKAEAEAEAERKRREREAVKKRAEGDAKKKPGAKDPKTRKAANKISEKFDKLMKNPKIIKFLDTAKYGWAKFKKWFVTLPVIRHWLASPYSMENYKKELGTTGKENSPHLKKNSAGVKMVKEGGKKFFK